MVFLGVEPRSVGVALAEGLCDLGGGIRAAEQPKDCSLRRLGCLLRDCLGLPAGRQITPVSQVTSVGTGAFRVAVLRGSPHQLTLSRNSRSML
jgi:hypothetical protein